MDNNINILRTGDMLHCSGKSWISKMIMGATSSRFSHTAIFVSVWGQPYVVDAQNNGVNLRPFKEWCEKYNYKIVVSRCMRNVDAKEFSIKAFTKVGITKYDYFSLLVRQPVYILTGKWIGRKSKDDNRMYCSDFAAWCHGLPVSWKMSPKDVYDFCYKSRNFYTFAFN